VNRLTTQCTMW